MQGIVVSDFISGGFYVSRFVERPTYVSHDLLPSKILSMSSCISPFLPDTWAIEWACDKPEDRLEKAKQFGLSDEIKEVVSWVTSRFDKEIGWPNVCYSLDTAQSLKAKFFSQTNDVVILGIGLHKSYVEKFINFSKPPEQKEGYAPNGESGVRYCIRKRNPLKEGNVLGFEPLVTGEHTGSLEDSWLCNGLEKEAHSKLGINLNVNGFIDRLEDAHRCVEYISRDDVGAEPGLWLPWVVVRY